MPSIKRLELEKLIQDQKDWIIERGGDLDGYIEFYHGKYNRTIQNASEIYYADMNALAKFEARLARFK